MAASQKIRHRAAVVIAGALAARAFGLENIHNAPSKAVDLQR
jgi:hypothetical protein